jgi:hypothetical protein
MSYYDDAVREYVWEHGRENKDHAWILSPFDSWHPNPFYTGPAEPHPEDYQYEDM